jgi:hypothetical protein
MSIKAKIFKQLSAYLMAKLQFNQVVSINNPIPIPNLKFVDKQMGQFNSPDLYHASPLPCILISFGRTTWNSDSRQQQSGDSIIRFYIYFENYADSFQGSLNQDKALQFFEFNEKVHQALQGLSGYGYTQLERVSDEDDQDHDMIIGTVFEYSTTITDDSADDARNHTTVLNKTPDVHKVKNIVRADLSDQVDTDNGFSL